MREDFFHSMHLPEQHWDCKLSHVDSDFSYVSLIEDYIAEIRTNIENGLGLFLFGPHSSGKSGLAAIILKAALVEAESVGLWIRGSHIARYRIEGTLYDNDTTMYQRCLDVPILVIDELIVRGDSRAEPLMEDLIRERIDDKRSLIITSNITPAKLKTNYQGIAEVLVEATTPVKIQGTNFREQMRNGRTGP